jgi:hypothetical protein
VRSWTERDFAARAARQELLAEVSRLRDKARKSAMLVDEAVRLAFFEQACRPR